MFVITSTLRCCISRLALCLGGSPASCLGQPVVCLGLGAAAGRPRVGWKRVGRICLGFSAAVPANHGYDVVGPGSRPGAPWTGFSGSATGQSSHGRARRGAWLWLVIQAGWAVGDVIVVRDWSNPRPGDGLGGCDITGPGRGSVSQIPEEVTISAGKGKRPLCKRGHTERGSHDDHLQSYPGSVMRNRNQKV